MGNSAGLSGGGDWCDWEWTASMSVVGAGLSVVGAGLSGGGDWCDRA